MASKTAAACRYLCGNFCGNFKDDHESPPNSDDEDETNDANSEDELYKPKGHKKAIARQAGKLNEGSKKGVSARMLNLRKQKKATQITSWRAFTEQITVHEKEGATTSIYSYDAIRADHQVLPLELLNSLHTNPKLHTVELQHCKLRELPPKLNELDKLSVLKLSSNRLESLVPIASKIELGNKCPKIKEFALDHNQIRNVKGGALSGTIVHYLEVVTLANNLIDFLPMDFLAESRNLKFLDLASNRLKSLPESILACRNLNILILTSNQLEVLPDRIEELRDLRKLFVSYNQLEQLPTKIGECSELQKIRVVSNNIRTMPDSLVLLWKQYGGQLEELLVAENPLVVPSITAFEMGGLDQAMLLFSQWIENGRDEEIRADMFSLKNMSLEDISGAEGEEFRRQVLSLQAAGEEDAEGAFEEQQDEALQLEDRETSQPLMQDVGDALAPLPQAEIVKGVTTIAEEDQQEATTEEKYDQYAGYYFGHIEPGKEDKKVQIRSAESSLMLLKRGLFFDNMIQMARKQKEEAQAKNKPVPGHLEKYLREDFNASKFTGKVMVTDQDLFFNLLVYATKPMFGTCHALFDKFQVGRDDEKNTEKGAYFKVEEWRNLCARVPVKVPEEIQDSIWKLLAWRDSSKLYETDFIAGWHIHDVEDSDPWIGRVAKVLGLEYYDMDIPEMQARLRARGADTATPKLDFDSVLVTDELAGDAKLKNDDSLLGKDTFPRVMEGERGTVNLADLAKTGQSVDAALEGAPMLHDAAESGPIMKLPKISLDPEHFVRRQAQLRAQDQQDGEDSVSDDSLESDELSEGTESSADSFDACGALLDIRDSEAADEADRRRAESQQHAFRVRPESAAQDLQQLMEMPAAELFREEPAPIPRTPPRPQPDWRPSSRMSRLRNKKNLRDARFKTDVFTVRQAVREAFRNLSYDDFVKIINFIQRGLKSIKHYNPLDRVTYWHCSDPTFNHSIVPGCGMANYGEQVLQQMGFVCVNSTYWVWPEKHLNSRKDPGAWGHLQAPPGCKGFDKTRLDDMILLFRMCRTDLARKGRRFSGHIGS